MIIDATFEIIRNTGVETVNARTISKKLNCSTQPVMYHFKTIDELKRAVYEKSDEYHSAYIMDIHSNNPMKKAFIEKVSEVLHLGIKVILKD